MSADRQFFGQFPVPEDFDTRCATISQARLAHNIFVHPRAIVEPIQQFQIHWQIAGGVARVVEAALRDAADQRHLTAFEANTNRAPRARGLAFAAASACLAVAAGLALAEALAAVLGAGSGFEIVQSHR